MLNDPGLARDADPAAFAEHFRGRSGSDVLSSPNIGGDAIMVVARPLGPCIAEEWREQARLMTTGKKAATGMTDYLEKQGAAVTHEAHAPYSMDLTTVPLPARGARVTVPDGSFFFDNLAPDALRSVVNTAMDVATPHYAENVARSGRSVEQVRIEEAALMVVLYNLRVFNDWRQHWYLRWKRLRITRSTLRNPLSHDQVVWYCQRVLGDGYAPHAAALLGMNPEEFATWEAVRQKFWEMW